VLQEIPIILLTAYSEPYNIISSIESGANKFLAKPFDHQRLPKMIDELYQNTKERKVQQSADVMNIIFRGKHFLIEADKVQILDLLLSSYEDAYYKNTQLQEARNELEQLNEALELKVQERTKELQEKDKMLLVQSRQAAMGEMISMIAHQLKQPLAIINMLEGNLHLSVSLAEEITEKILLEHIDSVANQVTQLSQTIEDFRNYFKPHQDKENVRVGDVLKKVIRLVAKDMQENNIEIVIDNQSQSTITIYANLLLQVLLNIVNNAKDMLKEKGVKNGKITITLMDTKESVITTISDNGGGIPEEIMQRIGEQYFTTKDAKGTGLGLYISKTILSKQLEGVLTWKNEEDGACFSIVLRK
jgi:C4-dicarboxylate-specific signal transduction histidine kinase